MNLETIRNAIIADTRFSVSGRKLWKPSSVLLLTLLAVGAVTAAAQSSAPGTPTGTVRVDITAGHAINSFDPDSALGSSIDVLSRRDIDRVYAPHILQEALSAGW